MVARLNTPARLLCFGAYGNGNLGDRVQPRALRALLARDWPLAEVYFTSAIRGRYDMQASRCLRAGTIKDLDRVNRFDALIIGGGGLCEWPHIPLQMSWWAAKLQIPTFVLACGTANRSLAEPSFMLFDHADLVTVRDQESLDVLQALKIKASTSLMHDPVYEAIRSGLCSMPANVPDESRHSASLGTAYVVKYPACHAEWSVLKTLQAHLTPEDEVVFFEKDLDRVLYDMGVLSPHQPATIVETLEETIRCFWRHRQVVSMRLHGVLIALAMGFPVKVMGKDKLFTVPQAMGYQHQQGGFSAHPQPMRSMLSYQDFWQAVHEGVLRYRRV